MRTFFAEFKADIKLNMQFKLQKNSEPGFLSNPKSEFIQEQKI
jgi:hypothetical protein